MGADDFADWRQLTLEDRIRRTYRVDAETAHRIAQKYLNLALIGLKPGRTIREAYTDNEMQELLDQAANTVQRGLAKQS